MLLNTCLTVRAHSANSHAGKGWEQFTEKVIAIVAEKCKNGVVFLAWGSPAAKRVERIDVSIHIFSTFFRKPVEVELIMRIEKSTLCFEIGASQSAICLARLL